MARRTLDIEPGADTVSIGNSNATVTNLFHQTVSAVTSFFLAMLIYPEVFAKAQEEVDRVIGRDKLPGLQNRPELPYIEAIEKETLRWNAILHLGTYAHTSLLYCLMLLCFRVTACDSRR